MSASRSANGTGSERQRADGRWEIRFYTEDPRTGARRRVSVYGDTLRAARGAREEVERRARSGLSLTPSKVTLGEWLETWITVSLPASNDSPNYRTQMQILTRKHLMTAPMAQLPLVRLRPIAIEDFVNSLRDPAPGQKTLSGSTIRSICLTLRRALDVAVSEGIIETNPTKDIALPRADKRTARSLPTEDAQRLLAELRTSRYYPAFALIATTGMRRGEALGLKWSDIDMRTGILTVRRTLSQATGGPATGDPKTSSSNRRIALPDGTRRILLEWAVEQQEDRARAGSRWHDDNWVFTNPTGGVWHPRNVLRTLQDAVNRLGLPKGTGVHTLRHTAATHMLEAGIHARAVADILGHASATTTLEIYGHTTARVVREAGDHLADALLPASDDTSAE